MKRVVRCYANDSDTDTILLELPKDSYPSNEWHLRLQDYEADRKYHKRQVENELWALYQIRKHYKLPKDVYNVIASFVHRPVERLYKYERRAFAIWFMIFGILCLSLMLIGAVVSCFYMKRIPPQNKTNGFIGPIGPPGKCLQDKRCL